MIPRLSAQFAAGGWQAGTRGAMKDLATFIHFILAVIGTVTVWNWLRKVIHGFWGKK